MAKRWLRLALKLRNNALRHQLSEFHTPLVKRVDLPDYSLCKHGMLVKSYERPESFRRESHGEKRVRRAVTLEDAMRRQPIRYAFGFHLLRRFAKCQRFGLRKYVCD